MRGHCHGSPGRRFGAGHWSVLIGLSALVWFLLRTGRKPSRIVYPCQKTALSTSWMFLGVPIAGFITSKRWPGPALWITGVGAAVLAFVFLGLPTLRTVDAEISAAALSSQAERIPEWVGKDRDFPGRVVHVHDTSATYWDYGTDWYGNYVDQEVVTAMVTAGLLTLTETQTVENAWETLIPDFEPGQKLVMKVNFNNITADPPTSNDIDAIIEPVNALLGGLIDYGFEASDLTVYDVTHTIYNQGIIPQRFVDGCDYPGVNFEEWNTNAQAFSDTAWLHFDPPTGSITDRPLANCLVDADYLINMPIAKAHDYAGMTLSFKNHFGTFNRCDYLHNHVFPSGPFWSADYSPLIEMYANHHIGGKTVLTVCDALFGNWEHLNTPPTPWPSFGDDAPNSILLSTDPVALDCVVADMLTVEGMIPPTAEAYLILASAAGLGVYERASSPGVYSIIDYTYLEAPFDGTGVDEGEPGGSRPRMVEIAPNPTSDTTVVHLNLPQGHSGTATVRLYDVRGRLVRTLAEDQRIHGALEIAWDARDNRGNRVASGVYWCCLDYEGVRETARVVLVR